MTYSTLDYRKSNLVGFVDIKGTERILASATALDLADVCAEIAWDEEVRVVVLEYDGEVALSVNEDAGASPVDAASMVEAVGKLKQPVIAAIRGNGVDIGLELALACDIRLGTETARFGLPQVLHGATPCAGGTQRLPRLVGQGRALEMVLTGNLVDSDEAVRIGLLNRVFSAGELTDRAHTLAHEMAQKSPLAVSYVKEALHNGLDLTLDQGLRMELDLYLLLFTTMDRVEGVTAFQQKRKPEFKGE